MERKTLSLGFMFQCWAVRFIMPSMQDMRNGRKIASEADWTQPR